MNESTPDLVDQEVWVVEEGTVYSNGIERRLAPYCEQAEPRHRVMAYVWGLLSPAKRKNSGQLAEVSGDTTPYGFQHLRRQVPWDPQGAVVFVAVGEYRCIHTTSNSYLRPVNNLIMPSRGKAARLPGLWSRPRGRHKQLSIR
jgi:hypothetical protein